MNAPAVDKTTTSNPHLGWRDGLVIVVPYLWLLIFFLMPILFVLKISLSHTALAQPPYTPVFDLAAGLRGMKEFLNELSLENYALIISDAIYFLSYLKSLEIAVVSTTILLLIGFPIAYGIARATAVAGN